MKKAFFLVTLMMLLLVPVVGWATTYYVDATNGSDSNPGTSESQAWKTVGKVNSSSFSAGDIIKFRCGETWYERLVPPSSGTSSSYILFTSYGSGDKPAIRAVWDVPGWDTTSNWTEESTNIWYIDLSTLSYPNPYRLWVDGIEKRKANSKANLGTSDPWWYDSTNKYLYVYSTSNPAIAFSSMKGLQSDEVNSFYTACRVPGKSHIKFEGISFEGGRYGSIYVAGSNHIVFVDCNIGKDGHIGIYIRNSNSTTPSTYCNVSNCLIDSNFHFSYTYEWDGAADGIQLYGGVQHCVISKNIIRDWGHDAINVKRLPGSYPNMTNNSIHGNILSASNISYGRPFEFYGTAEGECSNNTFFRNICYDFSARAQIAGDNNIVSYNLFYNFSDSLAVGGRAQAILLRNDVLCKNNKINNNTFSHIAEPAIFCGAKSGNTGNEIINNIMVDCGYDSQNSRPNICLEIEDGGESHNIKNNCIYDSDTTSTVYYRSDGAITVSDFNSKTSDTISDNISSDPFLTSTYHLSAGSPCIDAGIKVAGVHFGDYWKDLDGNSDPWGSAPDIGCYEYNTGEVGWTPGWFVRPSGGNYGDEDGTSYENAWNGFANIVWGTGGVQAGDTLWICGTHIITTQLSVGASGSANNYITIRMDYPNDIGLINGSDTVDQCVMVSGKSYIKFYKCNITNSHIHGFHIYSSNHIIIEDCCVYNNRRRGITINSSSDNIEVISCDIGNNGTSGTTSFGIGIEGSSSNITISGCLLHHNGNFTSTDGGGVAIVSGSNNVIIKECEIYSNGDRDYDGIGVETLDGDHVTITSCKIYNSYGGIESRGQDSTNYPSSSDYLKVCYCLIYDVDSGIIYGNYPEDGGQECEHGKIYNNTIVADIAGIRNYSPNNTFVNNAIFVKDSGATNSNAFHFAHLSNTDIDSCAMDYNFVYLEGANSHYVAAYPDGGSLIRYDTVAAWRADHSSLSAHDQIVPDLGFSDTYHLSPNSPCINAGTTISGFHETALDIDKQPILGTPDIGCDERKALWWNGRRWHMQRMY